jgi:hypothetical protein
MHNNSSGLRAALAATALAAITLLAACGGGGSANTDASAAAAPVVVAPTVTPPVISTGGTSTVLAVSGTITGFGSVIIDGKKYDDSVTAVLRGSDPGANTAGALTDLKLGMRIDGLVKDGKLTDAQINAALSGPVAAIDTAAGTFSVYGQTVKVLSTGATPTVLDGAANLAALAAGDVVEVHGSVDASRALTATRVERKPRADGDAGVRLGGVITSLNTSTKTFKLNDMTVDYSAASLLPEGVVLANGQLFAAFGTTPPVAGVGFKPKTVKVIQTGDGTTLEIGGRIVVYTALGNFTVSGLRIDASAATFEGGVASDLAPGVIVSVSGTVVDGVLKVTKVRVLKTSIDVAASLAGQVTEFVSAGSFKLRGSVVDASAPTVSFVGGSAADLGNGAWLLVKGKVSGDVLKADSVEFQSPPADKPVTLKGEIRDLDLKGGSFKFLGVTLKFTSSVSFSGGELGSLINGRRVEITGTPGADGVVIVSKITFLADLTPQPSVLGGRISELSTSLGVVSFKLPGGVTVNLSNSTVVEGGTLTDLAGGVAVLAKGIVNGQTKTMTATWLQIEKSEVTGVRVAGALSDFVSQADFRIGGQRVNASSAVFSDGTAADLANGRVLEVRGSIVPDAAGNKAVRASELRFLNK